MMRACKNVQKERAFVLIEIGWMVGSDICPYHRRRSRSRICSIFVRIMNEDLESNILGSCMKNENKMNQR